MVPCIVAFGSNLGDRQALIQQALELIKVEFQVEKVSDFENSKPMYLENQPEFLNGVLLMHSEFGPRTTLLKLLAIEEKIGRVRDIANGPRTIDLDLISYGCLVYRFNLPKGFVEIPHPRAGEREFVISPWRKIDADSEKEYQKNRILRPT